MGGDIVYCYARQYIPQIQLSLMCGSTWIKTWRLHAYVTDAKRGQEPRKISDLECVCKVLAGTLTVIGGMTILFFAFPMQIEEVVIDSTLISRCRDINDDTVADILYALAAAEALKLILVGRQAWKLRTLGKQFNESMLIGIVLFLTAMLTVLMMASDVFFDDPNLKWASKNFIIIVFALVVALVLLLPKFISIHKGREFASSSIDIERLRSQSCASLVSFADSDHMLISRKTMTKSEVEEISLLMNQFGYDVTKTEEDHRLSLRTLSLKSIVPEPNNSNESKQAQSNIVNVDPREMMASGLNDDVDTNGQ